MLPKLSIVTKAASVVVMISALLFLTTANCWIYGNKQKQVVAAAANTSDEEQDPGSSVPNPLEEKTGNALQNLSEYLHDHHSIVMNTVTTRSFDNRHGVSKLPVHHPELLTPPPRLVG